MTGTIAYIILRFFQRLQQFTIRWFVPVILLFSVFTGTFSFAQDDLQPEEILVFLNVEKIGGTEMPAYVQGQVIYLPLPDVFNFLKIQNTPSPGFDSVSGFFINPQAVFLVEHTTNRIHFQQKVFQLNPGDLIQTENNLYLRSDYFGQVFGLNCKFNSRYLSVYLETKLELPLLREIRQQTMRTNLGRLKGNMVTDTTIKRNFPFFHFGTADWSISATQQLQGYNNVGLNLSVGSLLAGGEADINLNYNNNQPFLLKQQSWLWHFANNDLKLMKQVMVGKIPSHSTSSINGSVMGFLVTNSPTTFQRSFGTYTISDYTQPGWIVELYVNYVLVDYITADASGYFSFEVPLVYGNSLVKLRFYGPWGEEHSREQTISIPFNFLPPKKFEYMVNGGFVNNSQHDRFSRADLHYGVGRRLTVGGGLEYLSSVTSGNTMPFVNFSLRLASSLLISGEYTYGVRLKGLMSYRLLSNIMIELYYTKLQNEQKAIINSFLEERKAVISMPVQIPYFSSLMRLTLYQIIMPHSNSISSEFLISGSLFGVSTNLTTYALFFDPAHPYIYTNLSLGFKLPKRFIITPQVQYIISQSRLLSVKIGLEKQFFDKGVINLLYDRNFLARIDNFQIGLRYDFPFAQTNLSARIGNNSYALMQYGRGSIINEGKEGKVAFSNYSSVGKGGIVILPFLDLNANGRRDKNELKVAKLDLRITGGQIKRDSHDSTIRISDLEPYNKYFIELDRNSFDNISWRIPNATIGITINPNQYKLIEVPITVMGEVSGYVYLSENDLKKGLGRINVCFYRNDSIFVANILTESDGYFSFLGLAPGSYSAKIDVSQLEKIQLKVSPGEFPFTILQSTEGDVVDGVEFVLNRIQPDTVAKMSSIEKKILAPVDEDKINIDNKKQPVPVKEQLVVPAREEKVIPIVTAEQTVKILANTDTSRFHIQVGAFRIQSNALAALSKLSASPGRPALIIFENGFYKLRITGFNNYRSAKEFLQKVIGIGFKDAFIHKNR